jgi:hypothetical protein
MAKRIWEARDDGDGVLLLDAWDVGEYGVRLDWHDRDGRSVTISREEATALRDALSKALEQDQSRATDGEGP